MKIRTGFVSNSSSSSFAILGIRLPWNEVIDLLQKAGKTDDEIEDDSYTVLEEEFPELESILDTESEVVYFGNGFLSMKDDETKAQFKKRTEETLIKYFGEKGHNPTWLEGEIYC